MKPTCGELPCVGFLFFHEARALYLRLGGSRLEAGGDGTTLIIPNRAWYDNLWEIMADQVRVVPTQRQ